ncbi:MAG: flagellar biosynthesis protein FlhB [Alphaproteobacteria bacterium]|nr:flagellar biosynthesis protein FlhB [Alphaproteobacteria bacterium]
MAEQEQDQDQKTEEATPKRLEEAREHGQVPISREVAMWVSLVGVLLVMAMVLPGMIRDFADFLRHFIESSHEFSINDKNAQALFAQVMGHAAKISGLTFLVLITFIILGFMVQTGFFFSWDLLIPNFGRIMPSRGLKRLFSVTSLVELGKGLAKLAVLGYLAFIVIAPIAEESINYAGLPIQLVLAFVQKNIVHLMEVILMVFFVIAVADLAYSRFHYFKGLRMTKTEVKEEYKQQEGDPMIKARLRQLRVEKARKRMMAQVPKADVVITNPSHYAVALRYDSVKMAAPVVVAKGINLIALRIREIAEESHVPLVSNPPLARALYNNVEISQQIPTQLYRAVAEVISYVYKLKKRRH